MKKLVLLSAALMLLVSMSAGQVYFHDDFQNVTPNNQSVASLDDTKWVTFNDNNVPANNPDLSYFTDAWMVLRDETGGMQAAALSYFQNSATADRWMVASLDLSSATRPVLKFRAKALDATNRDGFEVKISEAHLAKEDFVTLHSTSRERAAWTDYSIDLSDYVGAPVYLAFVQNSKDQYMIAVDDIWVGEENENAGLIRNLSCSPAAIIQNYPYTHTLKGEMFNAGTQTITSYTLHYSVDGGTAQTRVFTGLHIEAGAASAFEFQISVAENGHHRVEIYAEKLNGTSAVSPQTQAAFYCISKAGMPFRPTIMEIFSGGTCVNCPFWSKAYHALFDSLGANTPDNANHLVAVKYQVNVPQPGDPFVTDETSARHGYYIGTGAASAPYFRINGRYYWPSSATYRRDLIDSMAVNKTRSSNLGLTASLSREGNTFKVDAKVESFYPDPNKYALVICLFEDSIYYPQRTPNGESYFYNIVRKMLPGSTGETFIPEIPGEEKTYSFEYTFDLKDPKIFSSLDNMDGVAFLQNLSTKEIIQARFMKVGVVDPGPALGNRKTQKAAGNLAVYPNPARGTVNLKWDARESQTVKVNLYNLNGNVVRAFDWNVVSGNNARTMDISGLAKGTYVVSVSGRNGITAKKLIVK